MSESTPLIEDGNGSTESSGTSLVPEKSSNSNELKMLLLESLPLILTSLLQVSLTAVSTLILGRLGSDELAAVSLANMAANVTGWGLLFGLSSILSTRCSQSFGRKDYEGVGYEFMRVNYLSHCVALPIFAVWVIFPKALLTMVMSDEHLCDLAADYLRILAFGIPGFIFFTNGTNFLQSQGEFESSSMILLVCAPVNALLSYLFVWNKHFALGFTGAAWASIITNYLLCLCLLYYIFNIGGKECWPRGSLISTKYFKGWNEIISPAMESVLQVEAERLAFEALNFCASKLGKLPLAAQSIVATISSIFYQIPYGISIASTSRVAWFVGARSKKNALMTIRGSYIIGLFSGLTNLLIIILGRDYWVGLFTKDPKVFELAKHTFSIACFTQIVDSLTSISAAIVRGQGRTEIPGYMNLISYYVFAIPTALFLSFYFDFGLTGLWLGMIVGLTVASSSQAYFIAISDWKSILK